jgi:hypothetical protein
MLPLLRAKFYYYGLYGGSNHSILHIRALYAFHNRQRSSLDGKYRWPKQIYFDHVLFSLLLVFTEVITAIIEVNHSFDRYSLYWN